MAKTVSLSDRIHKIAVNKASLAHVWIFMEWGIMNSPMEPNMILPPI